MAVEDKTQDAKKPTFDSSALSTDEWEHNVQLKNWQRQPRKESVYVASAPENANRYNSMNKLKIGDSLKSGFQYAAAPGELVSSRFWFHTKIEAANLDNTSELHALLNDSSKIVAANSAIVLARLGEDTQSKLTEIVDDTTYSVGLRCAAAESLAALPSVKDSDLVSLLEKHSKGKLIPLTQELMRGLSTRVSPTKHPIFTETLGSPINAVRECASEIWRDNYKEGESLPEAFFARLNDPNDKIRENAYITIAKWHHPEAVRYLRMGQKDQMADVRCAAILGLGIEGSDEAVALLREMKKDSFLKEKFRAQIVAAFREAGKIDDVIEMADEQSAFVRAAVASSLADTTSEKAKSILRKYTEDYVNVQKAAIDTLNQWPIEHAAPILVDSLDKRSRVLSDGAKIVLAQHYPLAGQFLFDDTKPRKQEVVQQLRESLAPNDFVADKIVADGFSRRVDVQIPDEIRSALKTIGAFQNVRPMPNSYEWHQFNAALEKLASFNEQLIPVLNALIENERCVIPEIVFTDILPKFDTAFSELENLRTADSAINRRSAASKISEIAKKTALNRLAAERLCDICAKEQDSAVLNSVLESLGARASCPHIGTQASRPQCGQDARVPAIRIAHLMLQHENLESQKRAIKYISENGTHDDVPPLTHLFDSPNTEIVRLSLKAIAAIGKRTDSLAAPLYSSSYENYSEIHEGKYGKPATTGAYEAGGAAVHTDFGILLLSHGNKLVQADAALALCFWNDETGKNAITRLLKEKDDVLRLYLAREIGETHDPAFAPSLIPMLDESGSLREAALTSLPKLLGHDFEEHSTAEKVAAWKRVIK